MSNPRSFFVGWLLDETDRAGLLARIPPRYADVIAHHVTLKYGDRTARPPTATSGEIVGLADDGSGVQAVVIEIDGSTARPDGGVFHITWSLGPGRTARESNDVVARGWGPLPTPIALRLIPRTFGDRALDKSGGAVD